MLKNLGVPCETLPIRADTGDIVLFHSKHISSYGTKLFTLSQWDHVGFVIRWTNSNLKLFEATSLGVGLYKLSSRLEFLHTDNKIAFRRLKAERNREMMKNLNEFVEQMRGRPFKKEFSEIIGAVIKKDVNNRKDENLSSVFCSELVAAAYQKMGILTDKISCNAFLPKDWADKNGSLLKFENSAELERKRIFSKKKARKTSLFKK